MEPRLKSESRTPA